MRRHRGRYAQYRSAAGDDPHLNEAKIKTKGDLVFVFTVEEETTFKGVNNYVKENKGKIDQYIALDVVTKALPMRASASTGIDTISSGRADIHVRRRRRTQRRCRWRARSNASIIAGADAAVIQLEHRHARCSEVVNAKASDAGSPSICVQPATK